MTTTETEVLIQMAKLIMQLSLEARYSMEHGGGRPDAILSHPPYSALISESNSHILQLERYRDQGAEDQQVFAALRGVLASAVANLQQH